VQIKEKTSGMPKHRRLTKRNIFILIAALILIVADLHNAVSSSLIPYLIGIVIAFLIVAIVFRYTNTKVDRLLIKEPGDLWRGKVVPKNGSYGVMIVRPECITWKAPKGPGFSRGIVTIRPTDLASVEVGGTKWMGPGQKRSTIVRFILVNDSVIEWCVFDPQGLCNSLRTPSLT
jgi:hypothetical protein